MSTATTTEPITSHTQSPRSTIQPTNTPTTQLERSAAYRRRTTMAAWVIDVPLVQAAQNVVPVAGTAGDKIESLRQWGTERALSANQPGIYSQESTAGGNSRVRRVMREPGRN